MRKWVYRELLFLHAHDLVQQLNQLTESGWRLHSIVEGHVAILEREVTN